MENIILNIDLRPYNSFGVSAKAERFFAFDSTEQLALLFEQNPEYRSGFKVIGGGNNILLTKDQDQIILHPTNKQITLESDQIIYAQAGVEWDDLVAWCADNSLWGLENLSLIPGTVGAAPVQNIGAYGVEFKDVVESVDIFLPESQTTERLSKYECRFGYRDSIFKHELKGKAIITGVRIKLQKNGSANLAYTALKDKLDSTKPITLNHIRQSVIEIRESKLPDPKIIGNVGSFFKNPVMDNNFASELKKTYPDMPIYPTSDSSMVKIAAGWLIEKTGWKSRVENNVGVHHSQALVVVNHGGASGDDILNFANKIIEEIKDKFGIKIEMEVNVW